MSKTKAFISAARLRTLPLSVSGIIVGSAIAIHYDYFNAIIFVLALLTTICFQVLSNFANDYGDGVKGTDNEERIGPKRALQSGEILANEMRRALVVTSIISLLIAVLLIYASFGKENFLYSTIFFILGIASIVAAIKYTVGKSAYGYYGFGDVFVFLFFGLVSVSGVYVLYAQQFNYLTLLPACSIGFFSVAVLNLNNMRDRLSDTNAGKHTLAVKLGAKKIKIYHYAVIALGILTSLIYSFLNFTSVFEFFYIFAFVPFIIHLKKVKQNTQLEELDPELKKVALSTFLYAILFLIGQII
ncbi:1,4-dihydroxy-2-naphthoate octaprenyltransferase [Zhouia sp. PK063]|uniref:1,4-dihydroxy-2-naphthoate octaprenyltransferase n=1 Tax=Zhouia sp. PK063 TaxID=3373602 RepID=UPI0037A4F8D9